MLAHKKQHAISTQITMDQRTPPLLKPWNAQAKLPGNPSIRWRVGGHRSYLRKIEMMDVVCKRLNEKTYSTFYMPKTRTKNNRLCISKYCFSKGLEALLLRVLSCWPPNPLRFASSPQPLGEWVVWTGRACQETRIRQSQKTLTARCSWTAEQTVWPRNSSLRCLEQLDVSRCLPTEPTPPLSTYQPQ